MFTSSSAMFTFDSSRAPWLIRPNASSPGFPTIGAPDDSVSRNRLCPVASRPAGFTNRFSWIWPTSVGAGVPGVVT